jgi:signal peptidase II
MAANKESDHRGLRERLPGAKEHAMFWGLAVGGVALDLWSKSAIFAWMNRQGLWDYPVIKGVLSIVVRENPGAAFSIAEGQKVILRLFAGVAIVGIVGYFLMGRVRGRYTAAALGLFLGGVAGNLYDRLFNHGLVRDFIDVYWQNWHWPAFNVADSMLCTAVGLLLIRAVFPARSS